MTYPPEGFSVSWLRGFRQWRALKLGQDDLFSALETVLASPEDPSGDVRTLAVEEAVHNETGEDLEAWYSAILAIWQVLLALVVVYTVRPPRLNCGYLV